MCVNFLYCRFTLIFILKRDIGARPLLPIKRDTDSCSVGDGIEFEESGLEFGRGNLQGVDFYELLSIVIMGAREVEVASVCVIPSSDRRSRTSHL